MTSTLPAYLKQVQQLPEDLRKRECALVALGRKHAEDFDAGHAPSGAQLHRVLTELRKLAAKQVAQAPRRGSGSATSDLDAIRAKRASRLASAATPEATA